MYSRVMSRLASRGFAILMVALLVLTTANSSLGAFRAEEIPVTDVEAPTEPPPPTEPLAEPLLPTEPPAEPLPPTEPPAEPPTEEVVPTQLPPTQEFTPPPVEPTLTQEPVPTEEIVPTLSGEQTEPPMDEETTPDVAGTPTAETMEVEEGGLSFTVTGLAEYPDGLPSGSRLCLIINDVSTELCQGLTGTTGEQARLTFTDLSAGTYAPELRMYGHHFLRGSAIAFDPADLQTVEGGALALGDLNPLNLQFTWAIEGAGDGYGNWIQQFGYSDAFDLRYSGSYTNTGIGSFTSEDDRGPGQMRFVPLPNQTGTHEIQFGTNHGLATITIVFGDYEVPTPPATIDVVLFAGAYRDGTVPAGTTVCVNSTVLSSPLCQSLSVDAGPEVEGEARFQFTDLTLGDYTVTLSGLPGKGEISTGNVITLTAEQPNGWEYFHLGQLPVFGTSSLTITIDPQQLESPYAYLLLSRQTPSAIGGLAQHSSQGLTGLTPFSWQNLPTGTYIIELYWGSNEASGRAIIPVTIDTEGSQVDAGTIVLGSLNDIPLNTTITIAGSAGPEVTWTVPVRHPTLGNYTVEPDQNIELPGIGTYWSNEDGSSVSFRPAGPELTGTHVIDVMTSAGPGTITISFGLAYAWLGAGSLVTASLGTPWSINPVTGGTLACLINTDSQVPERCQTFPQQEPGASSSTLSWRTTFGWVPDGTYIVEFRNIPRHANVSTESFDVRQTDDPDGWGFWTGTSIQAGNLISVSEVSVEIDTSALPSNAQLCLVNDETGEEICESVTVGADSRTTIRAFAQSPGTITVTFQNVPVGTWRLILRVPGFLDLQIDAAIIVQSFDNVTLPVIPATIANDLEPDAPPVLAPITVSVQACDKTKSTKGVVSCQGRAKSLEGTSITYDIQHDGETVQTIVVPIGHTKGLSLGQSSGSLLPVGSGYEICQASIPVGYELASGSACVEVTLTDDGVTVSFVMMKQAQSDTGQTLVKTSFCGSNAKIFSTTLCASRALWWSRVSPAWHSPIALTPA